MLKNVKAREVLNESSRLLATYFKDYMDESLVYDAQFTDIRNTQIVAVGGFKFKVPALKEMFKDEKLSIYFGTLSSKSSHLFCIENESTVRHFVCSNGAISEEAMAEEIQKLMLSICKDYEN